MVLSLPVGAFECDLAIHRIRPPELVREDRDGVTYLAAEDYELAYETTLEFQNGARLPIKGKLFGEQNRQIVIRGSDGATAQLRVWVRGSIQLFDAREQMIFLGTYFDVDLVIDIDLRKKAGEHTDAVLSGPTDHPGVLPNETRRP